MTPVGFEPTQLALVELESTPLDHSGKVSLQLIKMDQENAARHGVFSRIKTPPHPIIFYLAALCFALGSAARNSGQTPVSQDVENYLLETPLKKHIFFL
jgi:hypothetical protein